MQKVVAYLRQSSSELRKVTWPSRPQAIRLTLAVVGFSIALGVFIGILDILFSKLLETIILKG